MQILPGIRKFPSGHPVKSKPQLLLLPPPSGHKTSRFARLQTERRAWWEVGEGMEVVVVVRQVWVGGVTEMVVVTVTVPMAMM